MKNKYEVAKNIFIDTVDVDAYIELNSSIPVYETLVSSLAKPLKMILLFGKPGTGKSILLNTLMTRLQKEKEIYYFNTPFSNEKEFFFKFALILRDKELANKSDIDFSDLIGVCRELHGKREIVILLDEAQMYTPALMEKIRLLADTRVIKFVLTLHKTDDEDLIAKEHFTTRIWEIIELKNGTFEDQIQYIRKKLLKENLSDITENMTEKQNKLMYRFTKGNYRECNKLMFTLFELCVYYSNDEKTKENFDGITTRLIEMAALKLGYIHA